MPHVIVVNKAEDIPKVMVEGKPTLVYWNILGIVHPHRLALVLSGVDFVDVRIDAPTGGMEAWVKTKPNVPVPFPNLPYYFDSNVAISQSDAILRCLGRTHDLMGVPGQELLVDQALDEIKDVIHTLAKYSYGEGPEQLAAWFEANVSVILSKWKDIFDDRTYITGDELSIADLKFYGLLAIFKIVQQNVGNDKTAEALAAGWVEDFVKRVEELPNIKAYLSSNTYLSGPWSNTLVAMIDF